MKRKLKIIVKTLLIFSIIFCMNQKVCWALSDNFKFIIDTIGIPRYNVNKQEINEEVYYTYNVFSLLINRSRALKRNFIRCLEC